MQSKLTVDWTRCAEHGLCGRLVQLDRHGYPVFLDMPVPFWLERGAQQAVAMCPRASAADRTGGHHGRPASAAREQPP